MKTGFSLCGKLHRENPVLALYWPCTGPVQDCSVVKKEMRVNLKERSRNKYWQPNPKLCKCNPFIRLQLYVPRCYHIFFYKNPRFFLRKRQCSSMNSENFFVRSWWWVDNGNSIYFFFFRPLGLQSLSWSTTINGFINCNPITARPWFIRFWFQKN